MANIIIYFQVLIFFFIQAMFVAGLLVEVWHVYEEIETSGTVIKLLQ
jgi:hypothetical protein